MSNQSEHDLKRDELLLRLLELKLHDFMLAYGSMRVALEEVLEHADNLHAEAFERLGDTLIAMLIVPDEKLYDLIQDARNHDEAHDAVDTFINDMVAPCMVLFRRYLGEEGAETVRDQIMAVSAEELHDRTDHLLKKELDEEMDEDDEPVDPVKAN